MSNWNFHNKTFSLVENSQLGKVNEDTKFSYKQDGNLVTADYAGGTIIYGKIIARLQGNTLHMLYQCLTTHHELKAGKATAAISSDSSKKIRLRLQWEWIGAHSGRGVSEYIEN